MENQLNTEANQQENNEVMVDPGQIEMFEETTQLDIGHDDGTDPLVSEVEGETIPSGTKYKVLAALAVVAVAGYVAYWVQEPLQMKADVIGADKSTVSTIADSSGTTKATENKDSSTASAVVGVSKNIDISLFGFEPAVLKIDKDTTVIWTNTSSEDQTIIGASKSGDKFTSQVLTSGDTFSHKFSKDDSFEYYSTYNPALKASITVGTGVVAQSTEKTITEKDNSLKTSTEELIDSNTDAAEQSLNDAVATTTKEQKSPASVSETTTKETDTKTEEIKQVDSSKLTAENLKSSVEELKPAANSSQKLTKTGPEDLIYVFALLTIAYFNRKKLSLIFNK